MHVMRARAYVVLREALGLPPRDRADIAGTLIHSLDQGKDARAAEAWAREIDRRLTEIEAGKTKLVSWEGARRRLRATLRRGRPKA